MVQQKHNLIISSVGSGHPSGPYEARKGGGTGGRAALEFSW